MGAFTKSEAGDLVSPRTPAFVMTVTTMVNLPDNNVPCVYTKPNIWYCVDGDIVRNEISHPCSHMPETKRSSEVNDVNPLTFDRMIRVAVFIPIAWHLAGILWLARKARHRGAASATVNAWLTSALLGLAIALAGGFGGGLLAWRVIGISFSQVGSIVVQCAGALAGSAVAGQLYRHLLNEPVRAWFAGEERTSHGS